LKFQSLLPNKLFPNLINIRPQSAWLGRQGIFIKKLNPIEVSNYTTNWVIFGYKTWNEFFFLTESYVVDWSWMSIKHLGCDVPSGTTQEWASPIHVLLHI
jgi:hypothetical protein